MKPLADQMAVYASYHNDATNRAIHYIFVPAIVWSLMGLLITVGSVPVGDLRLTLAHVGCALVLAYYLKLDYAYGVAMVGLFTLLMVGALNVAGQAGSLAPWFFGAIFVLGWAAQLVGHAFFEGRRPAFVDNLFQVIVAPLFVVAEWGFTLGLRKHLQEEVARKALAHFPRIPDEELPGRPL